MQCNSSCFRRSQALVVEIGRLLFLILLLIPATAYPAEKVHLKLATVIPDRTVWLEALQDTLNALYQQTDGRIRFTVYGGGIAGDELDILRKMRVGNVHAGFLSGVGLSHINPRVRIFETPGLFATGAEMDILIGTMSKHFEEQFRKKGLELMAFIDGGPIYIFSQHDLTRTERYGNYKMWAWKGDQAANDFVRYIGMNPVPLHISDVNVGLEMNMVDTFYGPSSVVVAFQWHRRINYMLDLKIARALTAVIIDGRRYRKIDPHDQVLVRNAFQKGAAKIAGKVRASDAESVDIMKKEGINIQKTGEHETAYYEDRFHHYRADITSKGYYSKDFYKKAIGIVRTVAAGTGIRIVVNSGIPGETLSPLIVQEIFQGRRRTWPNGTPVRYVVNLEEETHQNFIRSYLPGTQQQYADKIRTIVFSGKGLPPDRQCTTSEEVIQFVAKTKGAIGYVSDANKTPGIKIMAVSNER